MFPNIFPPPPSDQIDWDSPASVGASHVQVNGYVETRYQASKGQWTEPRLIENPSVAASAPWPSSSSHAETMIALRHVTPWGDKLVVFRPDFHAARMARSAAATAPPPPPALFTECVRRAVSANAEFVPPAESDGVLSIRAVLTSCSYGEAGEEDAVLTHCWWLPKTA
ncbi:hypothetical protein MAPG_10322 [Magnaporthiopsis poae ATCC 64411]|uniref:Branched-chain-amino-acid aminotransferase n=1 Tax=Magnaporthiopsis poae (strain ATCC 64411 / 73-15) TaxID=644358 RepID=A0A0C4ECA7_MAGP6|nr:hypothetical protein MAPG_10322 [Magnaporthiopsis poae ATCC 64411]